MDNSLELKLDEYRSSVEELKESLQTIWRSL